MTVTQQPYVEVLSQSVNCTRWRRSSGTPSRAPFDLLHTIRKDAERKASFQGLKKQSQALEGARREVKMAGARTLATPTSEARCSLVSPSRGGGGGVMFPLPLYARVFANR